MTNSKKNLRSRNFGGMYNVAVIGATGNVGRKILDYLHERKFSVNNISAFASYKSVGKQVHFGDDNLIAVSDLKDIDFSEFDIAFFCAGSEVSKKYAEIAIKNNCMVIDKSSYFRLNDDVPLIVPEGNLSVLKALALESASNSKALPARIISSPNCCVIPLVLALKPLDNAAKIKRIVISTYQSVSGAGKYAMDELYSQTKAKYIFEDLEPKHFPTRIAFNLFPHIGDFRSDGYTEEEYKIQEELKKILGQNIGVSVTCVRVPVFVSHSISVNVEFENPITEEEAYEILSETDGVLTYSHENEIKYSSPVDTTENDEVFVSRIRNDFSNKNTLNLWVTSDNLRKGAALNAVQIAEEISQIASSV